MRDYRFSSARKYLFRTVLYLRWKQSDPNVQSIYCIIFGFRTYGKNNSTSPPDLFELDLYLFFTNKYCINSYGKKFLYLPIISLFSTLLVTKWKIIDKNIHFFSEDISHSTILLINDDLLFFKCLDFFSPRWRKGLSLGSVPKEFTVCYSLFAGSIGTFALSLNGKAMHHKQFIQFGIEE